MTDRLGINKGETPRHVGVFPTWFISRAAQCHLFAPRQARTSLDWFFVGSLASVGLSVRIPAEYFTTKHQGRKSFTSKHWVGSPTQGEYLEIFWNAYIWTLRSPPPERKEVLRRGLHRFSQSQSRTGYALLSER